MEQIPSHLTKLWLQWDERYEYLSLVRDVMIKTRQNVTLQVHFPLLHTIRISITVLYTRLAFGPILSYTNSTHTPSYPVSVRYILIREVTIK